MTAESSRIFVRGLPPKITEDDFRKHFARLSNPTDVKLFPQRRIGYVGYKSAEEAQRTVKYFNRSFIRMSKIYVEIARPINDQSLPKSRKKLRDEGAALKVSEDVPTVKTNSLKRKRADDEAEQDPKLKEFLEVMQPPSKTKAWANEEMQHELPQLPTPIAEAAVVAPEDESDEEYQDISRKHKAPASDQNGPKESHTSLDESRIRTNNNDNASGSDDVGGEKQDVEQEERLVSDSDWLRSHTKRALDLVDGEDAEEDVRPQHQHDASPAKASAAMVTSEEAEIEQVDNAEPDEDMVNAPLDEEGMIRESGRLYLRNLPYDVTEEDIRERFKVHGPLEDVHVPISSSTGTGKGFAFVQYKNFEHAVEAYVQNDGKTFQGRLLHIISAKIKKDTKLDEFAISKLPLKKQREIKRKADASSSSFNWNSLYLNADSVMNNVANRLGIAKSELLDPTSSDAAVKQAHAETRLIGEVKSFFISHGVDLEAFKSSAKGNTAILVKNIPHTCSADDIRQLFEEHGTIKRFLMPPAGMTAIVEFANPAHAKIAFHSLAYRKIKDSVLFLERAPKDLFHANANISAAISSQDSRSDQVPTKLSATDLLQNDVEPAAANTATLYVRNLNFTTTTERLKETFAPLNGFRSAKVSTKVDPKRGVLSMGFGFVEFADAQSASAALRAMSGYSLEGHELQIKVSNKGADVAEETRRADAQRKAAGTKIIIKNLPFEASKKDIRALFSPYGQLRSVRVPKKFDSSSRGFGFAEFSTKRDAANAMEALRHTHLLGRRLALAFAEVDTNDPEKEIEKMQQKAGLQANKVALQHLTGGGRKKFNVSGNDDLDEA